MSVLDVVDTVVSKLARFSSSDIDDIRAMVDLGLVVPSALVERFESAMDWYLMDARADDLPRYVRNLNRVEREFLMVAPTKIEFPDWLDAE